MGSNHWFLYINYSTTGVGPLDYAVAISLLRTIINRNIHKLDRWTYVN